MVRTSIDKWPVEIKIVMVATSSFGQEFYLYFISGLMNIDQASTVKERLPVLSEFKVDAEKVVISTLVNQQQLKSAYVQFSQPAKEWRGQYYAVANKFVEACKEFVDQR